MKTNVIALQRLLNAQNESVESRTTKLLVTITCCFLEKLFRGCKMWPHFENSSKKCALPSRVLLHWLAWAASSTCYVCKSWRSCWLFAIHHTSAFAALSPLSKCEHSGNRLGRGWNGGNGVLVDFLLVLLDFHYVTGSLVTTDHNPVQFN